MIESLSSLSWLLSSVICSNRASAQGGRSQSAVNVNSGKYAPLL